MGAMPVRLYPVISDYVKTSDMIGLGRRRGQTRKKKENWKDEGRRGQEEKREREKDNMISVT